MAAVPTPAIPTPQAQFQAQTPLPLPPHPPMNLFSSPPIPIPTPTPTTLLSLLAPTPRPHAQPHLAPRQSPSHPADWTDIDDGHGLSETAQVALSIASSVVFVVLASVAYFWWRRERARTRAKVGERLEDGGRRFGEADGPGAQSYVYEDGVGSVRMEDRGPRG